jgi:Phosphotransferase enzyme family
VAEGVSTFVYRILCGDETFYLRVLPEEGASFAPEVAAHTLLRQRQVNVPEVIYFEQRNELLQRSIMMTTAIEGRPLRLSPALSAGVREAIVAEAGQDLAWINSVPVEGFGWVQRDSSETRQLQAQWPTSRAFTLESWEADFAYLARSTLSRTESVYEQHFRFTSLLINMRALARSLQKRPANRYTQHQLEVLQEDLAFLL